MATGSLVSTILHRIIWPGHEEVSNEVAAIANECSLVEQYGMALVCHSEHRVHRKPLPLSMGAFGKANIKEAGANTQVRHVASWITT